jgi:S-methyl-5-thioribose-1-phosphate isomerase
MYLGRIVEEGEPDGVLHGPAHPYSRALVSAIPHPGRAGQRIVLQGDPPNPADRPSGCAFHPRCRYAVERCKQEIPSLQPVEGGGLVSCHRARELTLAGVDTVVSVAVDMLDEDVAANRALAVRGAEHVRSLVSDPRRVRVLTHCNAGGLACVEWGTALGIVRALHEDGDLQEVFADETRPLLQGARLTAWELSRMGVPHRVVVDGAGATVIARGLVDVVIVGADRIAADGDVANKIGTYPLALAAARAGIPFVVAAPESTLDPHTASGADIHLEARDPDEVLVWRGQRLAPLASSALNLAFDVTPADLVTALVTEARVVRLSAGERLTG